MPQALDGSAHDHTARQRSAAVERVFRDEGVRQVFVAAGPVALPLLEDVLSRDVQQKLVEVSKLDMRTPDAEVLHATLDALREANDQSDRDDIVRVLSAFRARGLGTIGLARVRAALTLGQVDRLLVPAVPARASADAVSPGVNTSVERAGRGNSARPR